MANELKEKIIVHLTSQVNVELNSNNPDIEELINKIVENRDSIHVETLWIDYFNNSSFDKDGFESMLKKIIERYLNALKLDFETFEKIKCNSKTEF